MSTAPRRNRLADFRSDTVTQPTPAMRAAMAAAEVGDDGYADDPSVRRLEEKAAAMLGKQAGIFVPSGTMGNLVALLTHTNRGDEVLLETSCHILRSEMGGISALAGVAHRALPGVKGAIPIAAIEAACTGSNNYNTRLRPALLCLETTHNAAGGTVLPLEYLAEARAVATRHGLKLHIDGARVFNAAAALGVPVEAIARHADTITFCLSKGLGAPVGSVLCGPADWIARARFFRRMCGGTMRQSGVLAAAGLVALETMVERLPEDHRRARRLAEGLAAIHPSIVDPAAVATNMVFTDFGASGRSAPEWVALMATRGITCRSADPPKMRLVLHADLDDSDVDAFVAVVAEHWGQPAKASSIA
jgi:threonine aldolase